MSSNIIYIIIFLLLLFDSIINLFALTFYHFDTKLINLFNLQGSHEFIWTLRRKWTQFYRVIFNTAFIANAHLTKSWYHQALHLHEINVIFWLQFPGFYWEVTANGSIWFQIFDLLQHVFARMQVQSIAREEAHWLPHKGRSQICCRWRPQWLWLQGLSR